MSLTIAAVAQHDVLRREIAVHDAEGTAARIGALVDMAERFGRAHRDGHRVRPVDADAGLDGARANLAQATALDVLDDDVRLAGLVGGCFDDLRDAVVLQLRLDPGLIEEPRQERLVGGVVAPDDLDHAGPLRALDAGGGGQVDLPHPASGESLQKPQPPERTGNSLLPFVVPDDRCLGHTAMVPM